MTNTQATARTAKVRAKTWKIGEECMGGIIRAKIKNYNLSIEILHWHGRELVSRFSPSCLCLGTLENWLNEYTTAYHASNVVEWVKKGLNV